MVQAFRYPQSPEPWPLTNLTFFAGAGFSKAWDPRAPVGAELFTLDDDLLGDVLDPEVLVRQFGVRQGELGIEDIRQINYQIDMYERYPDIRSRYLDAQNLPLIRAALRAAVQARYAEIASLNHFDPDLRKFPLADPTDAQRAIMQFFAHLHGCVDGSQHFAEGLRTHVVTTNYDFVFETILDNILGPDDSLALYTYRGITPTRFANWGNPKPTHCHWLASHLLKLNGGFEIVQEPDGFALDYSARDAAAIRARPPIVMLPSREQDYSDPYFTSILPKAVRLMRDTQVLVIVGYSMPPDDALMRFVLRQFAEEPEDGRFKTIFYIDPQIAERDMAGKLREVMPAMRLHQVPRLIPFTGTFDEFARQYVSLIESHDRAD